MIRMTTIVAGLLFMVSVSVAGAGSPEDGMGALDADNHGEKYDLGLPVAPKIESEADTQYKLGLRYDDTGINDLAGLVSDYAEAAKHYRLAADLGHAGAQFELGRLYSKGYGVPQDYAEAAKWFRMAAVQGDATAQFNLGTIYHEGLGALQNFVEAVKWYRKAAESQNVGAQNNLGVMYSNGYGVPQDYAEAVKWYRRAAEQGSANAQVNLGAMYENGKGTSKNLVLAHMWFNIAGAQGNSEGAENRNRVARAMNSAQIAEAQRLAGEWKPSKPN